MPLTLLDSKHYRSYWNMYSISDWYHIPLASLSAKKLQSHVANLSITPTTLNYMNDKPKAPTVIYQINDTHLLVPKGYGIKHFGSKFHDNRRYGDIVTRFSFKGTLDEKFRKQETAYNAVMRDLTSEVGGATLALPPGDGKTAVALYVCAQIKKKTLVLVHKGPLMDQWKKSITNFLPEAEVGFLYGNVFDVEDKDIVLCMIQSLVNDKYDPKLLERFGFVIFDEAHHISAPKFSKSLVLAHARYTLALTGTPYRRDGADRVLANFIGGVSFISERLYTTEVNVQILSTDGDNPPERLMYNKKANFAAMLNDIVENVNRNKMILDSILHLTSLGRQVLVLSDRRLHLDILAEQLPDNIWGILVGGDNIKKQQKHWLTICEKPVILSTYPMFSEGMDLQTLSAVILATPRRDVTQAIARTLRSKNPMNVPWIIDFHDKYSMWNNLYFCRMRMYRKEKFVVTYAPCGKSLDTTIKPLQIPQRDPAPLSIICPF